MGLRDDACRRVHGNAANIGAPHFSFNNPLGRFNYTWQGFTLQNWLHPLDYPGLGPAIQVSIEIAFLSAIFATVLGTLIAPRSSATSSAAAARRTS